MDRVKTISLAEARRRLGEETTQRFLEVFRHGTLQVEIYAPVGTDPQTPHARDEVYVVVEGSGTYVTDAGRQQVGRGDFLFAAAGAPHRFEDFTPGFTVWVLFYGREGGEHVS
ncbi:MAG TPA: cupin domain-containing protein [Candidatus Polarisedimenticolia bacterium]|nr:cupin domain-containing protein [Candidatus Polarisedimenticolia bacterium]